MHLTRKSEKCTKFKIKNMYSVDWLACTQKTKNAESSKFYFKSLTSRYYEIF